MIEMMIPLNTARTMSTAVEIPELEELWVTPKGRHGVVKHLSSKFTKSGYVVVNVAFENVDPVTLETKLEWACISPMA